MKGRGEKNLTHTPAGISKREEAKEQRGKEEGKKMGRKKRNPGVALRVSRGGKVSQLIQGKVKDTKSGEKCEGGIMGHVQ